jgi:hypothetical protein
MAAYFERLEVLSMLESLRASYDHHRRDIIGLIILAACVIFLFFPMMERYSTTGDFPQHNELAQNLLANPAEFFRNTPHFLYHVFTAALYPLFGDMKLAGVWVMVICNIISSWIIYWQLRKATDFLGSFWLIVLSILITLCLDLIMPINIFTPENLYFGYFAPNVYHNPTVILVKPFALLLFFLTLRLFDHEKPLSRWWIIPFAVLTLLSLVAKPSFMIAFLPTLGLICLFYLFNRFGDTLSLLRNPLNILRGFLGIDEGLPLLMQRRFINWPVLMAGMVLPTFLGIYIQTQTWTSSGGIGIEPFRLFIEWGIQYEPNAPKLLMWKLLMSCAFPLAVYLLYWSEASRRFSFNLAWRFFAVSAAYAYLFVDYTDIDAGDFSWSAQLAIAILYSVAAIFLLQISVREGQKTRWQWISLAVCVIIFVLHMVAGLHWYNMHMRQDMMELIYGWW